MAHGKWTLVDSDSDGWPSLHDWKSISSLMDELGQREELMGASVVASVYSDLDIVRKFHVSSHAKLDYRGAALTCLRPHSLAW